MSPLIIALDFPDLSAALAVAERLDPTVCRVKVGKELFTRAGPAGVESLHQRGFDVFLDLKFHDIPHTVAGAVGAAAELGCWMVNVHASGGPLMLAAARGAVEEAGRPPLLIGVTVLTSMDGGELAAVGVAAAPEAQVLRLADLCADARLDGVVCSPLEAAALRARFGPDFLLVTPGVRPAGSAAEDQKRTATPAGARAAGADFLVVGRPVTRAPEPMQIVDNMVNELAGT